VQAGNEGVESGQGVGAVFGDAAAVYWADLLEAQGRERDLHNSSVFDNKQLNREWIESAAKRWLGRQLRRRGPRWSNIPYDIE
jgi:hypothetical protein